MNWYTNGKSRIAHKDDRTAVITKVNGGNRTRYEVWLNLGFGKSLRRVGKVQKETFRDAHRFAEEFLRGE